MNDDSFHCKCPVVASHRIASLKKLAIGLLALTCVWGGSVALSRPLGRWMRQSEGYVIVPRTTVEHVKIDRPGDGAEVEFVLDNVTGRPVTVLGAETSCDCTSLQGLPITIPAGGDTPLKFRLTTTPAQAGRRINTSIKLLLDTPSPVVALEIAAETGRSGTQDGGPPARAAQEH